MMNLGGAIRINKCGVTILLVVAVLLLLLFYNSQKSPDIPSSAGFGGASSSKISQAFNDGRQISVQALLIAAVDVAERGGNEVREVRQSSNGNLGEQIKGKLPAFLIVTFPLLSQFSLTEFSLLLLMIREDERRGER